MDEWNISEVYFSVLISYGSSINFLRFAKEQCLNSLWNQKRKKIVNVQPYSTNEQLSLAVVFQEILKLFWKKKGKKKGGISNIHLLDSTRQWNALYLNKCIKSQLFMETKEAWNFSIVVILHKLNIHPLWFNLHNQKMEFQNILTVSTTEE